MIDAETVDAMLRNDPDVSIVDHPSEFAYTVDVSVGDMPRPGRILIDGATSTSCVVFSTESVDEHLGEAFQTSERVANVALAHHLDVGFFFRAAIFREDSLPLAVTNTLQALAFVKINYDDMVRAKG